jgi:hypothetical protein
MPVTSPTRSSRVCGTFSDKRYRFSSSSAIRAMRRQESHSPGTVVEVLRPGYGEGSRQLRPAAVVVSRRGE